eukprot:8024149-Alexandrium_andersonii.AAC.1
MCIRDSPRLSAPSDGTAGHGRLASDSLHELLGSCALRLRRGPPAGRRGGMAARRPCLGLGP